MNKSYSALYRLSLRFSSQIWRGAAPNFKGAGKHDVLSRSPDLAKLYPNVISIIQLFLQKLVSLQKLQYCHKNLFVKNTEKILNCQKETTR